MPAAWTADNYLEMDRVSRPLLGVLLATVAAAALWVTMLKPSDSTSGGSSGSAANPSLGQLNTAVAAAQAAVKTPAPASGSPAGAGVGPGAGVGAGAGEGASQPVAPTAGTPTTNGTPATKAKPATKATPATHAKTATHTRAGARAVHHAAPPLTAASRLHLVATALDKRQVLAMLFFNPAGADDRLVKRELATISSHHGSVVKLAIPLSELATYSVVTQQVPVTGSPTLVIIDRGRGATQLVGFTSRFEIAQRIDDALAVK
jgi:hypothetical protein